MLLSPQMFTYTGQLVISGGHDLRIPLQSVLQVKVHEGQTLPADPEQFPTPFQKFCRDAC